VCVLFAIPVIICVGMDKLFGQIENKSVVVK
jgi:hypothetical protein